MATRPMPRPPGVIQHIHAYRRRMSAARWVGWYWTVSHMPDARWLQPRTLWDELVRYPGLGQAIRTVWMHMYYGAGVSHRLAFERAVAYGRDQMALDLLVGHIQRIEKISPALYKRVGDLLYARDPTLGDYAMVLAAALGELEVMYKP